MRKAVSFFVLLFFFSLVLAGGPLSQEDDTFGSAYDPQSGNYWEWYWDSSGKKHMRGKNYKTGSSWRSITEPDGDMSGLSKDGSYWQYKKGTGFSIRSDQSLTTLEILLKKGLITRTEYNKKRAELLK